MNYALLENSEIFGKIKALLYKQTPFFVVSTIYGIGVSVLSLAIPISVQSLVNTVTFGVLYQPLIVLSIVLLALLVFSGTLYGLQIYTTELFQRHVYADTVVKITKSLLLADHKILREINGQSLVNRYFDVVTIQKKTTDLLTGFISVILQTLVGMVLLAFYHPYFVIFDFLLILLLYMVWVLYGKRAMMTAVQESKKKYRTALWLEDVANNHLFFKSNKRSEYALQETDHKIHEYLDARTKHFRLVFSQTIFLLVIYAAMSAFILGLGGYLVIEGQLTLGQLVAAELVVTVMLASLSKSGKYLEGFYDLFAGIDKIHTILELKSEEGDLAYTEISKGGLKFENVEVLGQRYHYKFSFDFKPNTSYLIRSLYQSSRMTFTDLAQKVQLPSKGTLSLGDIHFELLSSYQVRDEVFVIDRPHVFEASISENLSLLRKECSKTDLLKALEAVELDHICNNFDFGPETKIVSSGYPLWASQLVRLDLARIFIHRPKVAIIGEIFDQVERPRAQRIIKKLKERDITLIVFTKRLYDTNSFDHYIMMNYDNFKEFDSAQKLHEVIGDE